MEVWYDIAYNKLTMIVPFKGLKSKIYGFLRKSEKYTKTDMVYITRNGFWVGLNHVIATICGLLLTVAFARLISQEAFGTYKFLLSLASMIGAFSLTGMGLAVTQATARGYEGALKTGTKESLKWSLGIVVISLCGALYYYLNENNTLALGLLLIGAFVPLINSFGLFVAFLQGKEDFKSEVKYSIPRAILVPVAMIGTILITENPVFIILTYFAVHLITIIIPYLIISKRQLNDKVDPETKTHSKHLSLINIIGTIAGNLDKVLLFHFLGAAPLAIYSFALAPIREISKPEQILEKIAFPKLSKQNFSTLKTTLPQKISKLMIMIIPIVALYILTAPYLYKILFPQYMESVIYSQVLALTLLFLPMHLFAKSLIAHMRKKEIYLIKTINPILNIFLLLILLPLYGIWGAIATIIITKIWYSIFVFYLFKRA